MDRYARGHPNGDILYSSPQFAGKNIHALGENVTAKELSETLATLSGKDVTCLDIPEAIFLAEDGVRKDPQVGLEMWLNFKNFYD